MTPPRITRRSTLKICAAAAAFPSAHIRTAAGAAGRLSVLFADPIVASARPVLERLARQWASSVNVDISVDFVSAAGNNLAVVIAEESAARTGHDVLHFAEYQVFDHMRLLEPVDDVVARLVAKYGSITPASEQLGRIDGQWRAVPAARGTLNWPCCARLDIFSEMVGMDLQATFPPAPKMGPAYNEWTWDAFLKAAEACARADMPFGLPISRCSDAGMWIDALFRSYGAELVDREGNVTVRSDPVRQVLDYTKQLAHHLPAAVYAWDNAANNRALIAGKSALIINPPSAWAGALRDQPGVGSQCWHFPLPAGPMGRFTPFVPAFLGIWSFSRNKGAAKDFVEWFSQREQVEAITIAARGDDVPPFESMNDFKVWKDAGPPVGTLYNYPVKPGHHAVSCVVASPPAPLSVASQISSAGIMQNMVARVTHGGQSIQETIAWAQNELEGFSR